ncbi:MAG: M14 family metallopeptidase [Armatimonadota bacterium]|nr:M14 family metallopeptidase [Armatimonadota bacterium]MDR7467716.1 M14 family metallopeptidase [Armatimonadota bacterium]MDR7499819.1 M14 family metallopeptidase [Armatimonadota bacterium]MDR7505235.1 M14 family metallopeptidase [Armatimonadota bacterium]MDR7573945.1 M14 family metallopeptidase [Armatimonadota bacterium]
MSRTSFAHLTPGRGERASGMVRVPGIEPAWEIPAFVLRGGDPGPTLAVTAGIHCAEYPGIAAALRLARETDPAELRGTLIVVPLVNTPGFYERSMYTNPRDGKNINRTFPGRPDGTPAERLTHFLTTELLSGSDAYVDLHGGDLIEALIPFTLYPRTGREAVDRQSEALAEAFDLDFILAVGADAVPGASYTAAAGLGVPAIIAEVGQQGILDPAAVERHVRGLRNVLIRLGMISGQEVLYASPRRLERFVWLRAPTQGLFYPAVSAGQTVEAGQPVGEVRDLFGEPVGDLRAPASGPVLFVVTALAVRRDDPLLGIGEEQSAEGRTVQGEHPNKTL